MPAACASAEKLWMKVLKLPPQRAAKDGVVMAAAIKRTASRKMRIRIPCSSSTIILLDKVIRLGKQRRGQIQSQGPGGLEVEHQLEFGRLLRRRIFRARSSQHPVSEQRGKPIHL